MIPRIDEVVLGKYRVVAQLARGGMGVVYHAVNVATGGNVALKFLSPFAKQTEEIQERMWREARAAGGLRSRFVTRIFDVERSDDGSPILVMELLEGHELASELKRRKGGRLEIAEAVAFVVQACAAVGEAHALGIVHRDLKPANLFLDRTSGTEPMVRVLDFGLTKLVAEEAAQRIQPLTGPAVTIGTPGYMSPEQLRSARRVDARTDVWALGVVLYRCLTGTLPYNEQGTDLVLRTVEPKPVPSLAGKVPPGLAAVVARALEKDPAARYPDARALGEALRPFVTAASPATILALQELAHLVGRRPSSDEFSIPAAQRSGAAKTRVLQIALGVASAALAFAALVWRPHASEAAPAPPTTEVARATQVTAPPAAAPPPTANTETVTPATEPTAPPVEAKRPSRPRRPSLPSTALPNDRMPVR